uniref:Uncharacterized protein n=1 Tax=Rhizophora mucronata TaxID=61149 RepID=A0A2P2NPA9_RHIMU
MIPLFILFYFIYLGIGFCWGMCKVKSSNAI